jgi:hypothetical protein
MVVATLTHRAAAPSARQQRQPARRCAAVVARADASAGAHARTHAHARKLHLLRVLGSGRCRDGVAAS